MIKMESEEKKCDDKVAALAKLAGCVKLTEKIDIQKIIDEARGK